MILFTEFNALSSRCPSTTETISTRPGRRIILSDDNLTIARSPPPHRRGPAMYDQERIARERGLRSAVLAGDELAWRQWYEKCYAGLHAYAAWRCGGLGDWAEEIVQETWLTAVRQVRRFDPERG